MRKPTIVVCLMLVTACGEGGGADPDAAGAIDGATPRDAPAGADARPSPPDATVDAGDEPDLSCLGAPPPAAAADPLTLDGTLFEVNASNEIAPLDGATLELRARADDAVIGVTVTDADGEFAFVVATDGGPIDAYFYAEATAHRATRAYPPYPLSDGELMLLFVATDAAIDAWYGQAGAAEQPGTGTVIAYATDCQREGLVGATIALDAAAAVVYYDDGPQQWDPQLASTVNGYAIGVNATPGPLAMDVTVGDVDFTDTAEVVAGELTLVLATPHQ